jgi:hypothetical protein
MIGLHMKARKAAAVPTAAPKIKRKKVMNVTTK